MKRILYIASHFPPSGGAGVQRSLKFVRYLPGFGILPTVLTEGGPPQGWWTPNDESLLRDVPAEVSVVRTMVDNMTTRSPKSNRLQLQAKLEAGRRILKSQSHELIFASLSPFADAWVAAALAGQTGLPWIADLRDPWALDEFQVYRSWIHRKRDLCIMRKALGSAALVIMNTPEAARRFRRVFPEFAAPVTSITNGYDAGDFPAVESAPRSDKFTIAHSGFLHTRAGLQQKRRSLEYRLLGRVEPGVKILGRSHYFLVRALERWLRRRPEILHLLRVRFIGAMTTTDRKIVERSKVPTLFELTNYLPHEECLMALRKADLLFLPLHGMSKGRRATIVPGKTYEYMACGVPILAGLPDGDARDFVTSAGTGSVCAPEDVEGMINILNHHFDEWRAGRKFAGSNEAFVQCFERRRLTEQLASELKPFCHRDRTKSVMVTEGA